MGATLSTSIMVLVVIMVMTMMEIVTTTMMRDHDDDAAAAADDDDHDTGPHLFELPEEGLPLRLRAGADVPTRGAPGPTLVALLLQHLPRLLVLLAHEPTPRVHNLV
jgi:hypothetical protein